MLLDKSADGTAVGSRDASACGCVSLADGKPGEVDEIETPLACCGVWHIVEVDGKAGCEYLSESASLDLDWLSVREPDRRNDFTLAAAAAATAFKFLLLFCELVFTNVCPPAMEASTSCETLTMVVVSVLGVAGLSLSSPSL